MIGLREPVLAYPYTSVNMLAEKKKRCMEYLADYFHNISSVYHFTNYSMMVSATHILLRYISRTKKERMMCRTYAAAALAWALEELGHGVILREFSQILGLGYEEVRKAFWDIAKVLGLKRNIRLAVLSNIVQIAREMGLTPIQEYLATRLAHAMLDGTRSFQPRTVALASIYTILVATLSNMSLERVAMLGGVKASRVVRVLRHYRPRIVFIGDEGTVIAEVDLPIRRSKHPLNGCRFRGGEVEWRTVKSYVMCPTR